MFSSSWIALFFSPSPKYIPDQVSCVLELHTWPFQLHDDLLRKLYRTSSCMRIYDLFCLCVDVDIPSPGSHSPWSYRQGFYWWHPTEPAHFSLFPLSISLSLPSPLISSFLQLLLLGTSVFPNFPCLSLYTPIISSPLQLSFSPSFFWYSTHYISCFLSSPNPPPPPSLYIPPTFCPLLILPSLPPSQLFSSLKKSTIFPCIPHPPHNYCLPSSPLLLVPSLTPLSGPFIPQPAHSTPNTHAMMLQQKNFAPYLSLLIAVHSISSLSSSISKCASHALVRPEGFMELRCQMLLPPTEI